MPLLPANWPTTGGSYNGTNANNTEAAVNAVPAKAVATVVATTPLPAGIYNNGSAGVGATFTVTATGTTIVDGHTLGVNDVVLAAGQVALAQNGPYLVTVAGTTGISTVLTRMAVMESSADFPGSMVIVGGAGLQYANTVWICSATGAPVIGTDALPFTQPQPTKRVTTDATTPATLTLNTDTFDVYKITGLANAMAIAASGGNPVDRDVFTLCVTDNGTNQTLSWSSSFAAMGIVGALPVTTPPGKRMTLQFIYDADISKWVLSAADTAGY